MVDPRRPPVYCLLRTAYSVLTSTIPTAATRRGACVSAVLGYSLSMALHADEPATSRPTPTALRLEVKLGREMAGGPGPPAWPRAGRLLVVLAPPGTREPRLAIGQTGQAAPLVLGRDVDGLVPGAAAVVDSG